MVMAMERIVDVVKVEIGGSKFLPDFSDDAVYSGIKFDASPFNITNVIMERKAYSSAESPRQFNCH